MEQPELIMTKITKQIWSAYQITEVACPVTGRAQPELTPSKRQKTGLGHDPTAPDSGETHV